MSAIPSAFAALGKKQMHTSPTTTAKLTQKPTSTKTENPLTRLAK